MEITTQMEIGTTYKTGCDQVTVPGGEWVRIQYGPAQNPTQMLLQQVPAGKTWKLKVCVEIFETPV